MEKKFFTILVIISLVACESLVQSNESVNTIGIIKKLEVSTWMYGTHTLIDENGKLLYALQSSIINLDNYENKNVIIFGNKIDGYPVDGGPVYIDVKRVFEIK